MKNSIKQIYVSLQIEENDLKILVAEYFNTRFNILKILKKQTKAINDFRVVDKVQLAMDIKALKQECEDKLQIKIEKTILVLPAYNFKRLALQSKIIPENGFLKKTDVSRAITNALKASIDSDVMVVDTMVCRYTINGISSRRMPENEQCNEAILDIDLLCCDKQMSFDYVTAVEESGLKVLDITLNTYSIAKESSLFEESLRENIILFDISRSYSYLSLLSKGKLISTEIIYDGINSIYNAIRYQYNIPYEDAIKLIKYDINYNSTNLDDVVYAYNQSNTTKTITIDELNEVVRKPFENIIEKIIIMCNPIIEKGASIYITGEGQQINGLVELLKQRINTPIKYYYPETIGVRNPDFSSIYGSLYTYHDKVELNNLSVDCIDLLEYDSLIDQRQLDTEGETITTKIKNLFKQYME